MFKTKTKVMSPNVLEVGFRSLHEREDVVEKATCGCREVPEQITGRLTKSEVFVGLC